MINRPPDAVHAFSATLDSIQIMVTAVEFGLKLKGLEDFGSLSKTVYLNAFELLLSCAHAT